MGVVVRRCDECGEPYEAKRARSRFCGVNCRNAYGRRPAEQRAAAGPPAGSIAAGLPLVARSTTIADRLQAELEKLGVGGRYEAGIVVGLAEQLDQRAVTGAAYVSLSKEVDRRVEALRMAAERPDDPAVAIQHRLEQKRLRLA